MGIASKITPFATPGGYAAPFAPTFSSSSIIVPGTALNFTPLGSSAHGGDAFIAPHLAAAGLQPPMREQRAGAMGSFVGRALDTGTQLQLADEGEEKAIVPAETASPIAAVRGSAPPFSFVPVFVDWTPVESFEVELGTDTIEYARQMIYSRLVTHFPELKNVPPERFRDIFRLNYNLRTRTKMPYRNEPDQSAILELHIAGTLRGFNSKYLMHLNTYDLQELFALEQHHLVSAPLQEAAREKPWSDIVTPTKLVTNLATKLPLVLCSLAEHADFRHCLVPGMLEVILTERFPELAVNFQLDRLLKLAVQSPEALVGHLREQVMAAERQIRELLQRKEIDARDADARIAALRAEEARIRTQVEAAAARLHELETAEQALRASAEGLKLLIGELLMPITSRVILPHEVDHVELIALGDDAATAGLQKKVTAIVCALIKKRMDDFLPIHREALDQSQMEIAITASLTHHERTTTGWIWKTTTDDMGLLLSVSMRTPSYDAAEHWTASLQLTNGASAPREKTEALIGTITELFLWIDERMGQLAQLEAEAPVRSRLAAFIAQRGAILLADSSAPRPEQALETVIRGLLALQGDSPPK